MTKSNTLTDTDTEESLTATIQLAKQDPIFKRAIIKSRGKKKT